MSPILPISVSRGAGLSLMLGSAGCPGLGIGMVVRGAVGGVGGHVGVLLAGDTPVSCPCPFSHPHDHGGVMQTFTQSFSFLALMAWE